MWKVDGYVNRIKEVAKRNSLIGSADKYFESEYEALRFMFDRSAETMDKAELEVQKTRQIHNRMCKKFGARLRELRDASPPSGGSQ